MFFKSWQSFAAALLLLLCFSCDVDTVTTSEASPPEPVIITYTIKKGQHSTQSPLRFLDATVLRFEATFDSSAIYTTSLAGNQADINKLFGVSDCGTDHHSNSARFGWRWYQGQLEIHAYTYQNKRRNTAYVASVQPGQVVQYELRMEEGQYTFSINGQHVTLPRACSGKTEGYQLYPYFGGTEPAPHDITIRIREL